MALEHQHWHRLEAKWENLPSNVTTESDSALQPKPKPIGIRIDVCEALFKHHFLWKLPVVARHPLSPF